MKDVIIWAGGPEVSYDSRETLGRLPELTGVMKGEGEKTFANYVSVWEAFRNIRIIAGADRRDYIPMSGWDDL